MKKLLFTNLLFISIPIILLAQKNDNDRFDFYYGPAIAGQDFSNLNNRIAAHLEFEQLENATWGAVLGWVAEAENVIFDYHFSFGGNKSGDAEKKHTNLFSFGWYAEFGYNFSKNKKIRFYPLVSGGYESFQAKLYKDISSIPFDTLLVSPPAQQQTESIGFSDSYFIYKLGAGLDFLKNKKHFRGIGIRAGYAGNITNRDWKTNDGQSLFNAPKDKLSQWFVAINFMFGLKAKYTKAVSK